MATKKKTAYRYHVSHSYIALPENHKVNFITQLYRISIYGIVNNNSSMQGTFTPSDIQKMERALKKAEVKGEISELKFGRTITVSDESGMWEEVIDAN